VNDVYVIAWVFAICFVCVIAGLGTLAVPDYPRCRTVGCPHHPKNK
jgi:hypothetical protein